jgi:hypothetical protein
MAYPRRDPRTLMIAALAFAAFSLVALALARDFGEAASRV